MSRRFVASPLKVTWHGDKVREYCRGESIYPATLELDLTSQCTRTCDDCPSSRGRSSMHLDRSFVERLLGALGGRTRGLLLTGGEPTMAKLFGWTLAEARRRGFEEIAVVTNGSLLDREPVANDLMNLASTIRVSLYDWASPACSGPEPTLRQIERLRSRIDAAGSPLNIGVSLLTSADRTEKLIPMAEAVRSAGAHWVYFHPVCVGWDTGAPSRVSQARVLEGLNAWRARLSNGFEAYVAEERYSDAPLSFEAYHGAHFLLVIGADGMNYLGAEVKYQQKFAIADVAGAWREDFLRDPARLSRIASVNSRNYTAIGSRHRGALYSHVLERRRFGEAAEGSPSDQAAFLFPHIL